jgi:hypothetical protein
MSIASLIDAQREFTAHLPAVENVTHYAFRRRRLRRQDDEDVLAEAIAACWRAWAGLMSRGHDPLEVGVCGVANQAVRRWTAAWEAKIARERPSGGPDRGHRVPVVSGRTDTSLK